MEKFVAFVMACVLGVLLILVIAFLCAIITQWAWDGSVGEIFKLQPITFWQAFWLNMLGEMVCKGSSVSHKS